MARAATEPRGGVGAHQRSEPARPNRRARLRHSRTFWLLLALTISTSVYALVGFKLVPRLVRYAATEYVHDEYGRSLSMGEIRVNPFKLHLEIRDLSFPDRDRKRLFSFGRMFLNFEALSSIWKRSWTFHEVTFNQPTVRAIIRPNGELNLADLEGKPDPEDEDDGLPRVWIEYLTVAHGKLDFIDRARRKPFQNQLSPLDFTLKDFRTNKDGGNFEFAATAAQGSHIAWQGNVTLAPEVGSHGKFAITGFPAATIAEYLRESLPFGVPRGKVDVRATYRASLSGKLSAQVRVSELSARDVNLRALGERESWVKLPDVRVVDAVATLEKRTLAVSKITLKGPRAEARLEQGSHVNLVRLFSQEKQAAVVKPLASDKKTKPARKAPPEWDVQLAKVEVENGRVDLEDTVVAPGTRFELSPIHAEAEGISLDLDRPVPVKIALSANDDADLRAKGTMIPEPFSAQLDVEVEDAELALGQPYVSQQAALTIRDGSVSAKGKLKLNQESAQEPSLSFVGDVAFTDFKSVDDTLHQDFVNFKGVELKKVKFTRAPDALEIERIHVKHPYARVVLSQKQVLNVTDVLAPKSDVVPAPATAAVEAAPATATVESAPTPAEPMSIKVGVVEFDDMRLNFSDYFVKPNFSAEIESLDGTFKGLSSDPKSRANLHLEGNLGESSPVVISGKIQPFNYDKFTDITFECSNIALPVFNPYSGRFAGYNIARGELTTELHYVVQKRKLDAQHHIRINQLTWGDRTDTKEKAPFPVRLATALLRDREGVINLDFPVNGTLDDPKFKVWPLVWQVVKNILVKAVTAPFDMLGSLFQGAEKARYVEFAPGKAELDQNAKVGLASLSKALGERPKLALDVPVGTLGELDRKAIADQKFEEGLQRSASATLSRRAKREGVPPFEELDEDQKIDALEKLYQDLTGKKPKVKEVASKQEKNQSRKAAKESKKKGELEQLTAMTREKITVEQSDLDALGRRRGETIEAELLKGGHVDSTRVLLSKKGKVSAENSKVRYELELK